MRDSSEIQILIERSLTRLNNLPPEQWGVWIVGVLEGLEERVGQEGQNETFEQALREVQNYLERRLLRRIQGEGN